MRCLLYMYMMCITILYIIMYPFCCKQTNSMGCSLAVHGGAALVYIIF